MSNLLLMLTIAHMAYFPMLSLAVSFQRGQPAFKNKKSNSQREYKHFKMGIQEKNEF